MHWLGTPDGLSLARSWVVNHMAKPEAALNTSTVQIQFAGPAGGVGMASVGAGRIGQCGHLRGPGRWAGGRARAHRSRGSRGPGSPARRGWACSGPSPPGRRGPRSAAGGGSGRGGARRDGGGARTVPTDARRPPPSPPPRRATAPAEPQPSGAAVPAAVRPAGAKDVGRPVSGVGRVGRCLQRRLHPGHRTFTSRHLHRLPPSAPRRAPASSSANGPPRTDQRSKTTARLPSGCPIRAGEASPATCPCGPITSAVGGGSATARGVGPRTSRPAGPGQPGSAGGDPRNGRRLSSRPAATGTPR